MKQKRNRKRTRCISAYVALFLSCTILLGVVAAIVQVGVQFDTSVDEGLFTATAVGRTPRFFAYRFTDRTNRLGEAYEITERFFGGRPAVYTRYEDLPQALIDAFVSIEDKRFFEHNGVDLYRTVAAAANRVLGFAGQFGASTITQQLIKNVTGAGEVTLRRKAQEILYAIDLERRLDKTQILELYVNVIHFSDQCEGVAAAAEHYFSKDVKELTVAECASIAAITNNPAHYNPIRHPENNLYRRNLILSQMHRQGYLSEKAYEDARATPLHLNVKENGGEAVHSWYTDMVLSDVIEDLIRVRGMSRAAASRLVYRGGIRIYVAMDEEVQKTVERYYQSLRLPIGEQGNAAQSAIIVLDSATGDILGVAGAAGEKKGNRLQSFATDTRRSPGSVIKPISVYAPALEKGIINWASVYDDVPVDVNHSPATAWPKNASGVYRGLTNISYAMAHSTNTVAVRVLGELGLRESYRYATEAFGLTSMTRGAESGAYDRAALALGQLPHGVTLRELTTAYTAFADGGVFHPWRSYYRVTDAEGNILLANSDRGEVVLSRENAAVMTKLLQEVVRVGTASGVASKSLVECAGKTGTTSKESDRWFVGYTADTVCGVWCGYEYPEPLSERRICTDVWSDVMRAVTRLRGTPKRFEVPSTLVRVSYCRDSGKLPCDACRMDARGDRSETGWFIKGSEPQAFCDCHILCACGEETGGICHGECTHDSARQIGLIRVERHFPYPLYVTDAQFVYRGDPMTIAPTKDPRLPYFAGTLTDFCGVSRGGVQFNRSCEGGKEIPPEPRVTSDEEKRSFFPLRGRRNA